MGTLNEDKNCLNLNKIKQKHPRKYHKKINKDYALLHQYITTNSSEEANVYLEIFKENLIDGYSALLKISKYQIDALDYIKAYIDYIQAQLEQHNLGNLMFNLSQISNDGFFAKFNYQFLKTHMNRFINKYCEEHYQEIVTEIKKLPLKELLSNDIYKAFC